MKNRRKDSELSDIEKEKRIVEQTKYIQNLKCPICTGNTFLEPINKYDFCAEKIICVNENNTNSMSFNVNSVMCSRCGFIMNFAVMSSLKQK